MLPGCVALKRGMTQIFDEKTGDAIPVTVVEVLPMTVTQVKCAATDGYNAVQVGYVSAKAKHVSRPEQGHLTKNNLPLMRKLQEFRVVDSAAFTVGQSFSLAESNLPFEKGEKVKVTGQSIGKGFQGATKRWHFARGPMSHGSKSHRLPGSIGAGTTPGRVLKGKKMAGRMGNETVTTVGLEIVGVLPEKSVLLIKGTVPGVEGGYLTVSYHAKPGVKLKVS
ncbi:MAG: 50S ribosomal protein L3 [Vampirovibrionales bacterium]|nr:50S ribosomal protein L3 [Vampirovibrionales bacterium]